MARQRGRSWVMGKYLALQLPGCVLVGGLLIGAVAWWDLSPWFALGLFALWVAKDLALFPFLRSAYESGEESGVAALIGARGVATEPLEPEGYVQLGAELWRAELAPGRTAIGRGGAVRVRKVRGMTLVVEPAAEENGDGGTSPHGRRADPC